MFPKGVPGGILVKNPPANAGNTGSIPGLGRSPGVGNGNSLQYSFLENSMDRGAWQTTVHGVAESRGLNFKSVLCKAETLFACLKGRAGGRNALQFAFRL